MKIIDFLSNHKRKKEIERLVLLTPLLNYKCRKYGFPSWEIAAVALRVIQPSEMQSINDFILMKGCAENGCKPLFWSPSYWQDNAVS